MSAAATRRFVAGVAADDRRRAEARRTATTKAARRSLRCDECDTELLTPAQLCGFCIADGGALAAELDNKESPAATGLLTHTGGNPE